MSKSNFLKSLLMMAAQLSIIESQSKFSTDSKTNLYNKLCDDPTELAIKTLTPERLGLHSPKDEWVVHVGDSVERIHFGSLLNGEALTQEDNYEDMCFRIDKSFTHNGTTGIGYFYGFGRIGATIWKCKNWNSLDFSGVYRCNLYSAPPSKYRDSCFHYYTDSGKEYLYLAVNCFGNGEVGWQALSTRIAFTEDEYEAVRNQVASLGFSTSEFPNTDFVKINDNSCNSNDEKKGVRHFNVFKLV